MQSMNRKVFSLKHVGEDEAHDVRELLSDHDIAFYETQENIWQTANPAIWLHDAGEYSKARTLIDHYQQQRVQQMRESNPVTNHSFLSGLVDDFKRQPLRFSVFFLGVSGILVLSIKPFLIS